MFNSKLTYKKKYIRDRHKYKVADSRVAPTILDVG